MRTARRPSAARRGRAALRRLSAPGLTGDPVVGGTVKPVAARWSGGWGDEFTTVSVIACSLRTGGDCEYLTHPNGQAQLRCPRAGRAGEARRLVPVRGRVPVRPRSRPVHRRLADPAGSDDVAACAERARRGRHAGRPRRLTRGDAGHHAGGEADGVRPLPGAAGRPARRLRQRDVPRALLGDAARGRRASHDHASASCARDRELAILRGRLLRPGRLRIRVDVDGKTFVLGRVRLRR